MTAYWQNCLRLDERNTIQRWIETIQRENRTPPNPHFLLATQIRLRRAIMATLVKSANQNCSPAFNTEVRGRLAAAILFGLEDEFSVPRLQQVLKQNLEKCGGTK